MFRAAEETGPWDSRRGDNRLHTATLKLHKTEDDEFPNPGIWEGTTVLATGTCEALKQESKLLSFITYLFLYTIRAAG